MQREEALEALVTAQDITSRVRGRGRWYSVYAAAFAVVAAAWPLALGFAPHPLTAMVGIPFALAALLGLSVYAYRQPVSPHHFGRLHVQMMVAWGVLHTVTMVVGVNFFSGVLWWWLPAALLCAAPPLAASFYARSRSEEPRA